MSNSRLHRHRQRKRPVYARCASIAGQESAEAPLREGGNNPARCRRPWIASSLSLLAMTTVGHTAAFPRHDPPGFCIDVVPRKQGGRRECRVSCAPAASCAVKKAHELVTTGTPQRHGIPCAMVYRL